MTKLGELSRMWRETDHRYRMVGEKCMNCEKIYFPPRDICPICHRDSIGKMQDIEMKGNGEVVSFTIVHDAPPAFSRQRPYILAIIKLDEGPVITGQIVDAEPTEIEIGTKLRSVFRKISEDGPAGIIHYGYKFVKDL
ncbi:MAG: Zn-ribbon domain-containing OB-fold protein [Thermoplasmataceae archaeon]